MQDRRIVTNASIVTSAASPAVVAGGFVFVSGLTALGADGRVVGDDIETQTRQVLDRLRSILKEAGSSLAQSVSVSVYLKRAADFAAMNGVYRQYFAENAPTRTTVVADVPDNALVQISAIAVPEGADREVIHPNGWMKSPRPYSFVVRAGGLVFLSGLLSRRGADDQFVPGTAGQQVRTILENAGTLLKSAGLSHRDVVAARVFLTDDAFFEPMNEEYRKCFSTAPPARATAVAGLMTPEAFAEITLVASTTEKQVVGPSVSPSLPLSSAVRTGRIVFLSGVLGNTAANADDIAGQTRETLTRIGRTLESAGLTFDDVVDNIVYLRDLSHQSAADDVYRQFFTKDPPARSTAGARLVARSGLIEMMMTAVAR